jgi:hypothetical protein
MQKWEAPVNDIKVSQNSGYDNCLDVISGFISDEYLNV